MKNALKILTLLLLIAGTAFSPTSVFRSARQRSVAWPRERAVTIVEFIDFQ